MSHGVTSERTVTRVTESPFKESPWDRHLDTLLDDLSQTVTPSSTLTRTHSGRRGVVEKIENKVAVPASPVFHERKEYTTDDNKTHVVEEKYHYTTGPVLSAPDPKGAQVLKKSSYSSSYKSTTTQDGSTKPAIEGGSGSRMKQNIIELDSLLDDLDSARKDKPTTDSNVTNGLTRNVNNGIVEGPVGHSTPHRERHAMKTVRSYNYSAETKPIHPAIDTKKSSEESTTKKVLFNGKSPGPTSSLDGPGSYSSYEYHQAYNNKTSDRVPVLPPFDGRKSPTDVSKVTKYDTYSSSTSSLGRPAPAPGDDKNVVYNYHIYNSGYESGSESQTLPRPPTEPSSNTTVNYYVYNYGTDGAPPGSPPAGSGGGTPPGGFPGAPGTPKPGRRETTTTTTTEKSRYATEGYSTDDHRPRGPPASHSPTRLSHDPHGPNVTTHRTVTSYQYTSGTDKGSPFPPYTPDRTKKPRTPDDGPRAPFPATPQRPIDHIQSPRKVDDLMASLSDSEDGSMPSPSRSPRPRRIPSDETVEETQVKQALISNGRSRDERDRELVEATPKPPASKNTSGPPVYYPPNHQMFTQREESVSFASGSGSAKMKRKEKQKMKMSAKDKHSETSAVVPICLPLCCGAACVVM